MDQVTGCVHYMRTRMIEKILPELISKREVVTALLEYSCFDYFFQVLSENITVTVNFFIMNINFSVL